MKKEDTKEDMDDMVNSARSFLLNNYRPVPDIAAADEMMSTIEIYQNLMETFPGGYEMEDVTKWLKDAGFVLHNTGHLKAQWLLKRV